MEQGPTALRAARYLWFFPVVLFFTDLRELSANHRQDLCNAAADFSVTHIDKGSFLGAGSYRSVYKVHISGLPYAAAVYDQDIFLRIAGLPPHDWESATRDLTCMEFLNQYPRHFLSSGFRLVKTVATPVEHILLAEFVAGTCIKKDLDQFARFLTFRQKVHEGLEILHDWGVINILDRRTHSSISEIDGSHPLEYTFRYGHHRALRIMIKSDNVCLDKESGDLVLFDPY